MSNVFITTASERDDLIGLTTRRDTRFIHGWRLDIALRLDGIVITSQQLDSDEVTFVELDANDIESSTAFAFEDFSCMGGSDGEDGEDEADDGVAA